MDGWIPQCESMDGWINRWMDYVNSKTEIMTKFEEQTPISAYTYTDVCIHKAELLGEGGEMDFM